MKSKKEVRLEKKAKKKASLMELIKLNENDKKETNASNEVDPPNPKRLCIEKPDEEKEKKPKLEGEEFLELKRALRARKKELMRRPRIYLRDLGMMASLSVDIENRVPLFITDIQHLLTYSQLEHKSPYSPCRWCQIDKPTRLEHTNILIIEGVSMYDFLNHESAMPFISSQFKIKLEILSSSAFRRNIVQDILMAPLTGTQLNKYIKRYKTLKDAAEKTDNLFDIVQNIFNISRDSLVESNGEIHTDCPPTDKFPRTQLLLSGWQMVEENFPLPIIGLMERKYPGYVTSKEEYTMVNARSPMFGVDCEMCLTSIRDNELTRVSLVDENHQVFYETLVKPHNKITNYLTEFSGITPKLMQGVTKRLHEVQEDLRRILPPDAILVGQSLNGDLHALKMFHPYVIDSSIIFNLTGQRARKSKLQLLSKQFLNESIQEGTAGHCSIEDSLASLKLVQLKLTKSLYFGDAVMSTVQSDFVHYPDMGNSNYATNMLRNFASAEKTSTVYSSESVRDLYKQWTFKSELGSNPHIKFVTAENNDEIIRKFSSSLKDSNVNIGHIQIEDGHNEYSNIDQYVKQMCEGTEGLSLQAILFTGHKGKKESGCVFLGVL